ncbi:DUF5947 family protein [Actinomadura scrupuli]|uniref:DUF5947 family protein n=1 Tax=Actinomadura scrupuli TaxID=559629 RepID=UPI003D9757DA
MSGATGLRRFRRPPAEPPAAAPAAGPVAGPAASPAGQRPARERCEICDRPIGSAHGHLVDVHIRGLMCACRHCYLLFTQEGSAGGRLRAVPDRYLYDPSFTLTDDQWERLQIPVGMAFFFRNSALDRFAAFYPSPAGATESLLPAGVWSEILAANPAVPDPEPDVEALLLRRREGRVDCHLVPIDACYDLVGRVRTHWRGFAGGAEAWQEIEDFFARLRERSRTP